MQRAHQNLVDSSLIDFQAVDSDVFFELAVDGFDDYDPDFFDTIQSPCTSPTRQTNPVAAPGPGFTNSEEWQFIDESNELLPPLQMTQAPAQTDNTEIAAPRRACTGCRASKVLLLSIANDEK